MKESRYQAGLITRLRKMFDGCVILKNDSSYLQGVPDILILYRNMWAVLEVKESIIAPFQPNQEFYIDKLNSMSFAAVIFPDNEEDVIRGLQRAFGLGRASRLSERL